MSTVAVRQRWAERNQIALYHRYFLPLLTESSVEYLTMLYLQQQYDDMYERVFWQQQQQQLQCKVKVASSRVELPGLRERSTAQ